MAKLTTRQAIELSHALAALDRTQPVLDADKKHVGDVPAYTIPGKAAYAASRTLGAARAVVAAYERARKGIVDKHRGLDKELPPTHPKYAEAVAEIDALLDEPVEVEVHTAPWALFEAAGLPVGILHAIAPMLSDEPKG